MSFRDRMRGVLIVQDTPHRIATSFAIGIFWGITPLLGLHTIGAFFMAWLLGLNRFVAIAGVCVNNPWTILPIYSCSLWIGSKIIGVKQILPRIDWGEVTLLYLSRKLTPLILPFVVGTVVVGAIASVIGYCIIYKIAFKYKRIQDGT